MNDTILDTIITAKRYRVEAAKKQTDIGALARSAFNKRLAAKPNRLASVLRSRETANIVAEIKRASPSKGVINDAIDVGDLAKIYDNAGVAAISVLTEEDHFHGSLDDLRTVRSTIDIPVLQKDFFIDEFQIFESAATGADAVLLIVAALPVGQLIALHKVANDLGMDAIVEVHSADEREIAEEIGAKIVGVNNRNLKTFEVSLDVSRELAASEHNDTLLISESGISKSEQIVELRALGFSGFLIGESLMRSGDPGALIRDLMSVESEILEVSTTQ